jgi:hypothetical protein
MPPTTRNAPPDDKTFIERPGNWPRWPFLPVKRYKSGHNGPECGLLIDGNPIGEKIDPEHKSLRTIYMLNLYDVSDADIGNAKKYEYESVEKMLIDGWVID